MDTGEPQSKKYKHSFFTDDMQDPTVQKLFRKHWRNSKPFKTENVELITEPFKICRFANFIKCSECMETIKNELSDVQTRRNCNDLYQFEETMDIVTVDKPKLSSFYQAFQTIVTDWMQRNTQIILDGRISMTSSCYTDTDYLLCHDDNLGDRRIAYVLYIANDWTEEDGGALDLFDTDNDGLPRNVVKSLHPEYNSLVFFEVTNNSFHQVAEIIAPHKTRWSINGWFHGPLETSMRIPRPDLMMTVIEPQNFNINLNNWMNTCYLHESTINDIQKDVEENSYAFLSEFFKSDVYKELSEAISTEDIRWNRTGPANLRNYEVADQESLPTILSEFYNIFRSIVMCNLLKNYTELDLVPGNNQNPRINIELQRWSKGCYVLITDRQGYKDHIANKIGDNNDSVSMDPKPLKTSGNNEDAEENRMLEKIDDEQSPRQIEDVLNAELSYMLTPESSSEGPESLNSKDSQDDMLNDQCIKAQRKRSEMEACSSQDDHLLQKTEEDSYPESSSDGSDIADYLSDHEDYEFDIPEPEDEVQDDSDVPGSLDVIMQFHTSQIPEKETIDYVTPTEEEGALIHVPYKDNHLCLVYKTEDTCRVQKYVNHYFKGYFYNLVCTYYE